MADSSPLQLPTSAELAAIAEQFLLPGLVSSVEPLGNGNVNDTYRVRVAAEGDPSFVLQRINTRVFCRPELVMGNMLACTEHVGRQLAEGLINLDGRRWEVPSVVPLRQGTYPWLEVDGCFWRLISFIDGSETHDTLSGLEQARELGYGLGMFHQLISDLPADALADTLEGFHITPTYLEQYQRVLAVATPAESPELAYGLAFVAARSAGVAVLEEAKARGQLRLRPIHGDPKVNNVLLDPCSGQAIGLVDLDTVKPGLVHYDIGDCLRSGCNRLGEDTRDWCSVQFDPELCEAILGGYGSVAHSFLSSHDYDYLFDAIRLIAFELGLRFLTDHLAGDVYFKTSYQGHNLDRALVQFRLTESIEEQEMAIRSIIDSIR